MPITTKVLVSVIIPAYNAAEFILATIESVRAQTFPDWELIVIDDGSTDNTRSLVATCTDPRVHLFSYPNAGVSTARNRAFSHAQGEFIALLDADDLWSADKLADQVAALQSSPQGLLVYSRTYLMSHSGDRISPVRMPRLPQGNVYPDLLQHNFMINGSSALVRRQAWIEAGGFDPDLTQGEDWEFYCRVAALGQVVAVPKPQIFYRQRRSSTSYRLEELERATLNTIDRIFQNAPPELKFLKRHAQANLYQTITRMHLAQVTDRKQVLRARSYIQKSLILAPSSICQSSTLILLASLVVFTLLPLKLARLVLRKINRNFAARDVTT